jgi:hypothetical protein
MSPDLDSLQLTGQEVKIGVIDAGFRDFTLILIRKI